MFARKYIVDCMKNLYNSKYITARDGNVSFKPKNANLTNLSPILDYKMLKKMLPKNTIPAYDGLTIKL